MAPLGQSLTRWQTAGVEPIADVAALDGDGLADRRGRYGIDGGITESVNLSEAPIAGIY